MGVTAQAPVFLDLLSLPAELQHQILIAAVRARGVKRGLRLRLVCRAFYGAVLDALYDSDLLLPAPQDDKLFGFSREDFPEEDVDEAVRRHIQAEWGLKRRAGIAFWAGYIVYRALSRSKPSTPLLRAIRQAAVDIVRHRRARRSAPAASAEDDATQREEDEEVRVCVGELARLQLPSSLTPRKAELLFSPVRATLGEDRECEFEETPRFVVNEAVYYVNELELVASNEDHTLRHHKGRSNYGRKRSEWNSFWVRPACQGGGIDAISHVFGAIDEAWDAADNVLIPFADPDGVFARGWWPKGGALTWASRGDHRAAIEWLLEFQRRRDDSGLPHAEEIWITDLVGAARAAVGPTVLTLCLERLRQKWPSRPRLDYLKNNGLDSRSWLTNLLASAAGRGDEASIKYLVGLGPGGWAVEPDGSWDWDISSRWAGLGDSLWKDRGLPPVEEGNCTALRSAAEAGRLEILRLLLFDYGAVIPFHFSGLLNSVAVGGSVPVLDLVLGEHRRRYQHLDWFKSRLRADLPDALSGAVGREHSALVRRLLEVCRPLLVDLRPVMLTARNLRLESMMTMLRAEMKAWGYPVKAIVG